VILSGTALTAAANLSPDFGALFEMANIDLWDITGNSYQFTQPTLEKDVPSGSTIEIINRYGNIEVTPAETDRISVSVTKTIIAQNETQAADMSKGFNYEIAQEGARYRIISNFNRDSNRVRGRRFKTSLTIQVPRTSLLVINNRNGDVDISGLAGDQNIRNTFGRVSAKSISGSVDINNRNDAIVVEDVTGKTTLGNEFGNIEARRVTGALDVRNRNGAVDVEQISGDVKIVNSFADVNIADVHGTLNVDSRNGAVDIARVEKDMTVDNRFESVKVVDALGRVNVDNENGSVELHYTTPPRNNVRVNTKFSDISIVLPSTSAFYVEARSHFATISSDFPELMPTNEAGRNSLIGRVGSGGPEIHLDNQNGNIRIER
jgi:hypothetical protein